jgi:hypothetical protein
LAECPQCHSSIEISDGNFGTLFNCPSCQAVFFIGWDGIPEAAQIPAAPPVEAPVDFSMGGNFSPPPAPSMETIEPASVAQEVEPSTFSDVVEFGNKPDLKSPLTYTITVKGIEIADIREKFKEAISDARFAWDTEVILKRIKGGEITFPDLSPAKATALINRIKYLPIRISWRQNVLS